MTRATSSIDPIHVLIIDDTAVVARLVAAEFSRSPDIQLAGIARSISEANEKLARSKPGVIILDLDIRCPQLCNFIAACAKASMPVIVMAAPTEEGAANAMEALVCGAIDVVCKPDSRVSVDIWTASLVERIRLARRTAPALPVAKPSLYLTKTPSASQNKQGVLAIGAGSDGTAALSEVLMQFSSETPGTIIVQHLPARLTSLLAQRLDSMCEIDVKEAETGDRISSGRALIAPGGKHIFLRRSSGGYFVEVKDGPELSHHKPSIDLFFNSVAKAAGKNATGAILSATAPDGAQGLLNLRKAGGRTIVAENLEDIAANYSAERISPLAEIPGVMIEMLSGIAAVRVTQ